MKLENVVPDICDMMAREIADHMTEDKIIEILGNTPDGDIKSHFSKWLANRSEDEISEMYKRHVEEPKVEETSVIRTIVVELPALGLSAVVESRITNVGGMENYEQEVISVEIDGYEYEVDSDVEDVILSLI